MRHAARSLILPILPLAIAVLASCGGTARHAEGTEQAAASATAAAPQLTDALVAKLAAADALDGATDHVIERCAGCNLGMKGKAEHPLHAGDYTLHLCSDSCRARFAGDLQASLEGLKVPQG